MSYNYEELSLSEAKDLLRQWREGNERRSEDVIEIWDTGLLHEDLEKLGNEKHLVLEQVIFAALDCHRYKLAYICTAKLSKEFPGSLRVMRCEAALLEAEENYDAALYMLDNIITADKTNSAARKRRVAVLKAQGQINEAITELVNYLNLFMSDVEAWQELCGLYLRVGAYSRAAFCAEELLLHQPHAHLHLQRLADIRYTMGGVDNLELAKTYYSQALKLNPDNMRALLGLFLTTNSLLGQYKGGNSGGRAEAWKLCQWAQRRALAKTGATTDGDDDAPLAQVMLSLAIAE